MKTSKDLQKMSKIKYFIFNGLKGNDQQCFAGSYKYTPSGS